MALSVTTYAIGPDVFLKANEGNHRADGEIIGSVLSIVRVYGAVGCVGGRRPRRIEGWRSGGARGVWGPPPPMRAPYLVDQGFFGSGGSSS